MCIRDSPVCEKIYQKNNRQQSNIFRKSQPHMRPQPNPLRRKWPQMDYLVMNCSSKWAVFIDFYNMFDNFSWNPTFPFKFIYKLLQRMLCSDFRSQLLFLFYENQHPLKKWVSYLAPGQATKTKMAAYGFSSYELFVNNATFELTLRLKVCMFLFAKKQKTALSFSGF